jgi:diaminohydroxyphosphoribosylaminopyrimidine deaminase / 5-amino-6-(5-phosphoribosylamino)uracil reductase
MGSLIMQQKSNKTPEIPPYWTPPVPIGGVGGPIVIGQIGQSLDGQVATATGESKYINGAGGLLHLHRLRAWAEVVIVGVGTVLADDPQLTVRLLEGRHPARLVLDPSGRVPVRARVFTNVDAPRFVMTRTGVSCPGLPPDVEHVCLDADSEGGLSPLAILQWISNQGWRNVLIEGGPLTLSRFMNAGLVDYLHLITSAVLLGQGKPGLSFPAVSGLLQAQRFSACAQRLDDDLLIECDLKSGQRQNVEHFGSN